MLAVVIAITLFSSASIYYVYAHRGSYRYTGVSEYMRKCWPMCAPLNCLLYMATERRARQPIMDLREFQELNSLQENWDVIRQEALALYEGGALEAACAPGSQASYDVGFHTFFKAGWRKFYLKWYGYTHTSANRLCPQTVRLLEKIPSVKGAMFTLLPPGAALNRHCDPFACSLRYHLGLSTPNSDDCWINVDGIPYSWRDGEALLFDETYVHHAYNGSDKYRLILMCDVARPMNIFGRMINWIYSKIVRLTIVPNTDEDKRGGANKVFSTVTPMLQKGKQLKATNKKLYLVLKYSLNTTLLLVALALLAVLIYIPYLAVTAV